MIYLAVIDDIHMLNRKGSNESDNKNSTIVVSFKDEYTVSFRSINGFLRM